MPLPPELTSLLLWGGEGFTLVEGGSAVGKIVVDYRR
jgi:hypothetical protein